MNRTTPFDRDGTEADPERTEPQNAFDSTEGYSGQEYTQERARAEAVKAPSGQVDPKATRDRALNTDRRNIPPEAGRRAWVDPATGEVHGSGSGAGAGGTGEDYDSDSKGGGGNNAPPAGR